ncbi:MAG: carboxypeptidase-like regulatory domain-containing protein [Bacteroidota bacterium]|jgi:hypothetical protein|nr:hypothetical protein [Anaerophaga sp.]MDN5291366.1 hypothetical protein [Anaerophaga sp.]
MKAIKLLNQILILFIVTIFTSCEDDKVDIGKYGSLSGIILNGADYSPLSGVLISTSPSSSAVLTDEEGKFNLEKVLEGEVALTARKKDFLSSSVNVAVYEGENTPITLYLLKDEKNVGSVTIYDPVPGNGAVDQQTAFTLKWSVEQQNKDKQLEYTVYYFESGSIVQKVAGENLTLKEVPIDNLNYSTIYYWHVVAKYEGNIVANSPTWSFKTRKSE